MNQKTDVTESPNAQQEREFSPDFIRVAIALTGATLLLVFLFEYKIVALSDHPMIRMYFYPWVVAAGHTIVNGIAEFSGKTPTVIGVQERVAALLGLLFGFVIGPTLFFFGWYNRRKDRASGTTTPSLKGSAVISVIGGIITFAVAIPSIPMAIIQYEVSSSMQSAQAIQENKDQMIINLNMIAVNARQYRILPRNIDWGDGSFLGYAIPQTLAATEAGTYTAAVTADDITLNATSKKYSDCKISAHVNKEGQFAIVGLNFEGRFQ
jgi:hypothetical protein